MNDINYINIKNIENIDLKNITTSDLKKALSKSLEMTAKHLVLLGKIWVELEERNVDLSELKNGLSRYLSLIGNGKLDPDVVIQFAGHQTLLKELALLSIPKQRKLLKNSIIKYVTRKEKGNLTINKSPIEEIPSTYYPLIFESGHIRNEDEQKKYLAKPRKKRISRIVRKKKITVNVEEGYISVSNIKILTSDLIKALKDNNCF